MHIKTAAIINTQENCDNNSHTFGETFPLVIFYIISMDGYLMKAPRSTAHWAQTNLTYLKRYNTRTQPGKWFTWSSEALRWCDWPPWLWWIVVPPQVSDWTLWVLVETRWRSALPPSPDATNSHLQGDTSISCIYSINFSLYINIIIMFELYNL